MKNEEIIRIVESFRNKTLIQLESASEYILVFLDKERNTVISIDMNIYQLLTGTEYRYYLDYYAIEKEPYLICDLKFFKVVDSPLPF